MPPLAPMLDISPATGTDGYFPERVCALVAERFGYTPRAVAMPYLRGVLAQRRDGRPVEEYWRQLLDSREADGELQQLVEDLLNHDTVCGRTPPHFEAVRRRILPELAGLGRTVRLASLGCSTGEEAYTLALTAVEAFGALEPPAEIVGLDLSRRALAIAREGRYPVSSLRELTLEQRELGFVREPEGFRVRPAIARLVRFARHNLMLPLPLVALDAIFCRNVLIYFNSAAADTVLRQIRDALAPGGWLFLGHSETALHRREWFEPVRFAETLAYRRR